MTDLRQACDRCHDKKLRCPKQLGALACGRCVKAGASCTFSPPTKPGFNGSFNGAYDTVDWLALMDFGQQSQYPSGGGISSAPQSTSTFSSTPSHPLHTTSDQQSQDHAGYESDGHSSVTARLANVLVILDGISRKLPAREVHHASMEQMQTWADEMGQLVGLRSILEDLLSNTQHLVILYPEVIKLAASRLALADSDQNCRLHNCIHQDQYSREAMPPPGLDYALLNLLLACHMKLLDILESIIGHGRMCAHVVNFLPKDHEPQFDVPEIRIGSFVAPRAAAASMMVNMLVELQGVLVGKSKELSTLASKVSHSSDRQAKVLSMQCDIMCDRTTDMLTELSGFRQELTKRGLMM